MINQMKKDIDEHKKENGLEILNEQQNIMKRYSIFERIKITQFRFQEKHI